MKKELEVLQPGKRCVGDSDEWNELRACKQSGMWIWIRMIGTYQMNLPIYTDCIGRCTDVRFLGVPWHLGL